VTPVAGLLVGGAGLGELPGHPAHLHHRHRGAVGEHGRHLQDRADLVADPVRGRVREGLGAVPAGQEERLAAGGGGDPVAEHVDLAGEHQRGRGAQIVEDLRPDGLVGPHGLLHARALAPGAERREAVVGRGQREVVGAGRGVGAEGSHADRVASSAAARRRGPSNGPGRAGERNAHRPRRRELVPAERSCSARRRRFTSLAYSSTRSWPDISAMRSITSSVTARSSTAWSPPG
jgi:hypothetical protein